MPKLVVSTVGTSLLTNQIDTGFDPNSWESQLLSTVNASEEEMQKHHSEVISILEELKERAEKSLGEEDPFKIRAVSAELNGIYGLYSSDLSQGYDDAHLLVTTDTNQGWLTVKLLEEHLRSKGIYNTSVLSSDELSIANNRVFSEGIARLLPKLQQAIQGYQNSKYDVCFNLVGGFKALQGFFNVIGMFYADEIIYVFEGSKELIKIPKLPIRIDPIKVKPYAVPLAMMSVGDIRTSWEEAQKVPLEWAFTLDKEMTLSTWGTLIWSQCEADILKDNLLQFPNLEYTKDFKEDYKKQKDNRLRLELQKKLSQVAQILHLEKNGISALRNHKGIDLYPYTNTTIEHIKVSDELRVSCKILDGGRLSLRYYGTHKHVEGKEGVR